MGKYALVFTNYPLKELSFKWARIRRFSQVEPLAKGIVIKVF